MVSAFAFTTTERRTWNKYMRRGTVHKDERERFVKHHTYGLNWSYSVQCCKLMRSKLIDPVGVHNTKTPADMYNFKWSYSTFMIWHQEGSDMTTCCTVSRLRHLKLRPDWYWQIVVNRILLYFSFLLIIYYNCTKQKRAYSMWYMWLILITTRWHLNKFHCIN